MRNMAHLWFSQNYGQCPEGSQPAHTLFKENIAQVSLRILESPIYFSLVNHGWFLITFYYRRCQSLKIQSNPHTKSDHNPQRNDSNRVRGNQQKIAGLISRHFVDPQVEIGGSTSEQWNHAFLRIGVNYPSKIKRGDRIMIGFNHQIVPIESWYYPSRGREVACNHGFHSAALALEDWSQEPHGFCMENWSTHTMDIDGYGCE